MIVCTCGPCGGACYHKISASQTLSNSAKFELVALDPHPIFLAPTPTVLSTSRSRLILPGRSSVRRVVMESQRTHFAQELIDHVVSFVDDNSLSNTALIARSWRGPSQARQFYESRIPAFGVDDFANRMAASPHVALFVKSLIIGEAGMNCEYLPASCLSRLRQCLYDMPNVLRLTFKAIDIQETLDTEVIDCFRDTLSRLRILTLDNCAITMRFLAHSLANCIHTIQQLHLDRIEWITAPSSNTSDPNFITTYVPPSVSPSSCSNEEPEYALPAGVDQSYRQFCRRRISFQCRTHCQIVVRSLPESTVP